MNDTAECTNVRNMYMQEESGFCDDLVQIVKLIVTKVTDNKGLRVNRILGSVSSSGPVLSHRCPASFIKDGYKTHITSLPSCHHRMKQYSCITGS